MITISYGSFNFALSQGFCFPEIKVDLVRPEIKKIWTGSQKIFFSKAYQKLLKEFYSRFSISRHQTAVEVFEVLSVAMTSSPEVVRTK